MLAVLLLNRMRSRRQKKLPKQKVKTPEIVRTEAPKEYCRTCLCNDDLVSIFYNSETADKWTEDLKLVTGLEIKIKDGLSQKICLNCIESVNQAIQFRLKCVKNDGKIRKQLQNGSGSIEYYLEVNQMDDNGRDLRKGVYNDKMDENDLSLVGDFQTDHDYLDLDADAEPIVKQKRPVRQKSPDRPGKVYKCHICDKVYNRRLSYRAHVNRHTNYFVCEECGKRCVSKTNLLEHKRALHGLARIHVCQHCDYSSATKAGLLTHSRRHTGERPFVCSHCAAAFHSRAGLLQHLPIHLPESNFECAICQKREKSKRLLQHHIHKSHRPPRRRFACPLCGDVFRRPDSARMHLTRTHGVKREELPAVHTLQIETPETDAEETAEEFETQHVIFDIK